MKKFNILLILLILLISACSTQNEQSAKEVNKQPIKEAGIFMFPKTIEGYSYITGQRKPNKIEEYSARYGLNINNYADVYIYSIPQEAKKFFHKDLNIRLTEHITADIKKYQSIGGYFEFNLDRNYHNQGDYRAIKTPSYTLIYLAESKGKQIKVRMTIPDNVKNRQDKRWSAFASKMLNFIITNIDKA